MPTTSLYTEKGTEWGTGQAQGQSRWHTLLPSELSSLGPFNSVSEPAIFCSYQPLWFKWVKGLMAITDTEEKGQLDFTLMKNEHPSLLLEFWKYIQSLFSEEKEVSFTVQYPNSPQISLCLKIYYHCKPSFQNLLGLLSKVFFIIFDGENNGWHSPRWTKSVGDVLSTYYNERFQTKYWKQLRILKSKQWIAGQ